MKAHIQSQLENITAGTDEMETFIKLISLPDEKFNQIYPELKSNMERTFNSTQFQEEVLKNIKTISTENIDEEKASIEALIEEIKTDDSLSEEKKDILTLIITKSTLAVYEMIENPRIKIEVKIQKITEDAIIPTYAHPSDAGADIYANEDVTIKPGETTTIGTGIKVAIPDGYEIQLRPRSGLSLKTGLRIANAPGTIDSAYRGEIRVIMTNINDGTAAKINKGDRIAQMVIAPVPMIKWVETDNLDETDRGENGFGSTDISK